MPMMRRGPLDRYPPEWVLRQANAHDAGGSIEFHTDRPVTFYLDNGRIYAAEEGVSLGDLDRAHQVLDEDHVRGRVMELLGEVLGSTGGWYFHDPLGHHPARGAWTWETASLLMDTRATSHEATTLAAWADRVVDLHETPAASITLGPDAWAIVVALTEPARASELRLQLGWPPDRVLRALSEIEQRGVLGPEPAARPSLATTPTDMRPLPPPPSMPPAPRSASDADGHHTGPLAPPPSGTASRTLLRSRRTNRRPDGS